MGRLFRALPFIVGLLLSFIAWQRTDFSPEALQAALPSPTSSQLPVQLPSGPYRFFGQGRQSFVFVSADGSTILKFFNRKYLEVPWYGTWRKKEREKRNQRTRFFFESYPLAEEFLKEETALLYVHTTPTQSLPSVLVIDKASRPFQIDLNHFAFVVQKRAAPLYERIDDQNVFSVLDSFFTLLSKRISSGLDDAEHDIEHNFGLLEDQVVYLDPGRLTRSSQSDAAHLAHEWWSGTHQFRKWIESHHPEALAYFDAHTYDPNTCRKLP